MGRWGLVAALVAGCQGNAPPAAPRIFGLHAIWFAGAGDGDRETVDAFLRCLVEGSNLHQYWQGEAGIVRRGSWALPAPAARIDRDAVGAWLDAEIAAGRLPPPRPDETPLYLVFGEAATLRVGACGRNGEASVGGQRAAMALVRIDPPCWPTDDRVRSETQIATHEIVESVDRLLGYSTCAGGGTCRGRDICPDRCDTFVGLACPGAPTGTPTGCRDGVVDGWVVQKFAYSGRNPDDCDRCAPCDFTPRACAPDEPRCAAVPSAPP